MSHLIPADGSCKARSDDQQRRLGKSDGPATRPATYVEFLAAPLAHARCAMPQASMAALGQVAEPSRTGSNPGSTSARGSARTSPIPRNAVLGTLNESPRHALVSGVAGRCALVSRS